MNNENKAENKVVHLRLDDIIPNRFQPREVFDETGLEELADSIREHGIIQPIIVRQIGDKYELIAGERRSKASAMAGLTTIPAIVRNMDDRESAKVSLLENLQRKNLSAIEEARTYKKILELEEMTQEDLARTMGKSQPLIANKLRLLSLPEEVQDALIKNQISERHARSLLNVKNKEEQLNLLDRVRNERLTVRELDVEIKKLSEVVNPSRDMSSTLPPSIEQNQIYNNFTDSYQGNFNNMGLNDYKTQVSSNLFNNIPNNYNNIDNNMDRNSDFSFFNQNLDSPINTNLDKPSNFNFDNENYPDNQSSLASMFDQQNMSQDNRYQEFSGNNGQNMFISHIKEDIIKPKENQFLPNFNDEVPANNFENEFTQFSHNNEDINNNFDSYSMNRPMSTPSFDNNFIPYEEPTNFTNNLNSNANYDFSNNVNTSVNSYQESMNNNQQLTNLAPNQGNLFNQPLNIVDVRNTLPTPSVETHVEDRNQEPIEPELSIEQEIAKEQKERTSFDNPLDDQYENILFAKPVPIQLDEPSIDVDGDDIEVIDEEVSESMEKEENKYISLDQEQTIFDVRGAILELKKTTDVIKSNGFDIETEEINFDDVYQIVIKIKKEQN